ncbi:MAG: O-antigen/teichoic acid export membrane protein [Flavobacteriales bacterium]|jgi:O-antigen/teichoic acid export membrane protein
MGIVIKQSFNNLVTTFLGFGIGALNTLFLYVNFMSDAYYGLVGFLLSTAMILMPFLAFGVHNTLVKFYSSYAGQDQDRFLLWMLLLPLAMILPATGLCYLFYEQITLFLSTKNEIFGDYLWYILLIAIASAYFEVFFAWSKVHMKTSFGNFMKEVFHRVGTMCLLILLAFDVITIDSFLKALVGVYIVRMVIMKLYAYRLRMPKLSGLTKQKRTLLKRPPQFGRVLKYTSLIIIAGSVATLLMDLDKFMIGKYELVENIAYYSVAIYMATVIAVPVRAMHQITYPMVAKLLNEKKINEIKDLYVKSSLTLFVISSLLFLLISCNVKSLYLLIDPTYAAGLYVVLLIGSTRVLDNILGINNAILFNSDYYRLVLILGIGLVSLAVILNMYFIPRYGIQGAAIATFIASFSYSLLKIAMVRWKFGLLPFSKGTLSMLIITFAFFGGFYFWDFDFHPLTNILLKSGIIGLLFVAIVHGFNVSPDISNAIRKLVQRD